MCLVCHQMSTESGGTAGIATFSVFTFINCPELHCLWDQAVPLRPVAPAVLLSIFRRAACSCKGQDQEEWGMGEARIGIRCTAMPSVTAQEPLGGWCPGLAIWDLVPGLFVLRLHEFSIPLGKQFRALILKPNLDSWSKNPCLFSKL